MTTPEPSPRTRIPTVKEVAKLAGVSPMTVSRTLSGGKNVRAEVQEKVAAAVAALGYQRNENARSIRSGHTSGLIGVAITNLGNPYYGQFALGVDQVASEHGYRIMLGNTSEDVVRERQLISDFVGRRVEGLIVVPTGEASDHLTPVRLSNIPLVFASRTVDGMDVDTVQLDDVRGAHEGTQRLIESGHRRIAFLGNLLSISTARRRYEGFCRAHEDAGLSLDQDLVMRGQQDAAAARSAMEKLLSLKNPPTAVFSANNRNTIGALQAIGSRKDSVGTPPAPTLVSFDDVELAELMRVPLIVISHDPKELGAEAARMLFDRLEGKNPDQPSRLIELPVDVRVLETTL